MDKLILPRPHLSWSAISCWRSSPARFRREYFECGKKLDTKYLRFGKGIAEMIENGTYKELLPDLEVYDVSEYEMRVNIRGVPMLAYIDDYDPENNVFREKKTGKRDKKGKPPWTQAKVIKHDQLLVYATCLKHIKGKIPDYCHLDWIETKMMSPDDVDDFWRENEKQLQVTGVVKSFYREFDEREIERMEDLIEKSAREISDAYQAFLKEI